MQEELLKIWETTGKTILFITHSVDEAIYLSTDVAVIKGVPQALYRVHGDSMLRNDSDPMVHLRERRKAFDLFFADCAPADWVALWWRTPYGAAPAARRVLRTAPGAHLEKLGASDERAAIGYRRLWLGQYA